MIDFKDSVKKASEQDFWANLKDAAGAKYTTKYVGYKGKCTYLDGMDVDVSAQAYMESEAALPERSPFPVTTSPAMMRLPFI